LEAERIKKAWGNRNSGKPAGTLLEVPSVGERPTRVVSYATLNGIIEPRALELLELVQAELARSGCDKELGAGVVLVGGGAKLAGLVAQAEQILGVPVRLGDPAPAGLANLGETLPDPAYATAVGLVAYGNRLRLLRDSPDSGWLGKLWRAVRAKAE
jgi:cell division protein FtsA